MKLPEREVDESVAFQVLQVGGIYNCSLCFFFNDTATTEIYTLSLHDALPISDVHIRSFEGMVMLIPREHPWESLINSLDMFSDDYMSERNQPEQQRRGGL